MTISQPQASVCCCRGLFPLEAARCRGACEMLRGPHRDSHLVNTTERCEMAGPRGLPISLRTKTPQGYPGYATPDTPGALSTPPVSISSQGWNPWPLLPAVPAAAHMGRLEELARSNFARLFRTNSSRKKGRGREKPKCGTRRPLARAEGQRQVPAFNTTLARQGCQMERR